MMNYEIFKEVVKDKFKDYLPGKYQKMEVKVNQVGKVNRTLDGINLVTKEAGMCMSPTIYINDMYEHYKQCGDLQAVLQTASENMVNMFEMDMARPTLDYSEAKDNIVFQLVNTEQNKEMLAGMPHREYQDLSVIYRWVVGMDENGIQSTMIKNDLAGQLGFTEEQLFNRAAENTRRLFPPVVKSMNEVMCELFMKDGMPQEIAEMMIGGIPEEQMMYVITNDRGLQGAASMLYEDKLHSLSMKLEDDLYILPSSIHEVLAVPASMGTPESLAEMVSEVNMNEVSLDERLSNQVYHYDKDLRRLSLATDTPNKRLDGIVSEPPMVYETKQSR